MAEQNRKAWILIQKEYLNGLTDDQLDLWKQQYRKEQQYQTTTHQTLHNLKQTILRVSDHQRQELRKEYQQILNLKVLTKETTKQQALQRHKHWQTNKLYKPFYHSRDKDILLNPTIENPENKQEKQLLKTDQDIESYFANLVTIISPIERDIQTNEKQTFPHNQTFSDIQQLLLSTIVQCHSNP